MAVFIPVGGSYDIRYRVNLDGVAYDIRTRWNNRSESWYLYLGLTDQDPIFKTRMVVGWDILDNYRGIPDCPQGQLYVVDVEKVYGRPTFEDLGLDTRFRLMYLSEGETIEELISESQ